MEDVLPPTDQQKLVSSFLEIAVGQTAETARQFLQATSWKLEEAIQLFYVGNEGRIVGSSSFLPAAENITPPADQSSSGSEKHAPNEFDRHDHDVRPPLPVIREALYDDAPVYGASRTGNPSHPASSLVAFRNFDEEMKRPGVWDLDQGGTSTTESNQDNLAALYRPPFALMYRGTFEKAKNAASSQDKWLLVNLQSTTEFTSHMLNRDTWAHEAVTQSIKSNFIFWQVYDDSSEGKKVCTYYKVESIPVILVIDPITGQKMRLWSGMVHPDRLLEDLLPFLDGSPRRQHVSLSHKRPRDVSQNTTEKIPDTIHEDDALQQALAASMENMKRPIKRVSEDRGEVANVKEDETCSSKRPTYPPLPEEPKGDRSLLCRLGFRLPDGRRVQRNFLRDDPIQILGGEMIEPETVNFKDQRFLLWSFCDAQLGESESRLFRLGQAIPGSSKFIDYDSKLSIAESGLANSMISVTWV